MASRNHAYQSSKREDGLETLSTKLSADLRGSIRAMGTFPLLSEPWCKMAATLGRIAEISDTEAKIASECRGEQGNAGSKTLWEGEERALRYVLEDGKLNVCLRSLIDWREFHGRRRQNDAVADEQPSTTRTLDAFEKGMGVVLRNAWTHIEALQTTDIPLLVGYLTRVFREATDDPGYLEDMRRQGDLLDRQEVVCLYYLRGLVSRLEDYDEDRVMPHVRSAGTASSVAKMLHVNHEAIGPEAVSTGAEALAYVCDTEDFATYRDEYIANQDKKLFAALKEDFVADLCADADNRKKLRC